MSDREPAVWIIRAGRMSELDSLFLVNNFIALGWSKTGDLRKIPLGRDVISSQIANLYPNEKVGAIPGIVGKLLRFANEMTIGDLVIYPSKINQQIYIGQVTGTYKYDPIINYDFAHLRPVKWSRVAPRKYFSTQALAEIGSILALYQINKNAHEFQRALVDINLPSFTSDGNL